ncbi:MAG: DUF2933 domain-containing protein [Hyphomicrobiaceae bacterium]|nr:MAG: DUF2933 domain-containing protein [Hyphomicrobiaceae bacterium]
MAILKETHHTETGPPQPSFWSSRAFLICAAFLLIGGFLIWTEHLAHALGFLPYLLIVACPLLHIFMHGGHGHGGHHDHRRNTSGDRERNERDGGKP